MICRMQAREVFSRFWGPGRQARSTPWQEQLSGHPSLAPLGHIHLDEKHRTLTELRYWGISYEMTLPDEQPTQGHGWYARYCK